jgi:DNA-binding LacI/PurR family transcriptional regulator
VTADIRQVAAEAGVSTATVSRVMSGRGPASARATAAVRSAARLLGYLPNSSASSLRTDRSMIIGVVVPNLANPVFLPFLRTVEHRAQRHGYAVLVADTQHDVEVERRQLDRLGAQRVDALVFAGRPADPDHVRRLSEAGLPIAEPVTFARQAGYPFSSRAASAIDDACGHLATVGHRRLAYVSRGGSVRSAPERWRLIEASCRSVGIEPRPVVLGTGPGGAAAGVPKLAATLASLVKASEGPTVLWSNSQVLAPLLLEAMAVAGIDIPADCSFLTFGDSAWAVAFRPSVSVITTDLDAVAVAMTASILQQLGVPEPGPPVGLRPDVFVIRGSIGAAPTRV